MPTQVEQQVSTLEEVLATYISETRADQARRTQEMTEFKDEMRQFKDEMRQFKDEMRQFKDEMQEFKEEMRTFREEMRADRREMNKKWGELANRLGTIVEDIVAPNVPGFMSRYFQAAEPDFFALRVRKRHPTDPSRRREFDVIAVSGDQLFFVEAKATVRREYLASFAADYGEILEYFPEYRNLRLTPVFSSFYLKPDEIHFLSKHGIYALMMSDESMDLANFESVQRN